MIHFEAMPTNQVVTQRYPFLIPSQPYSAECRTPGVIKKTLVWQMQTGKTLETFLVFEKGQVSGDVIQIQVVKEILDRHIELVLQQKIQNQKIRELTEAL